MGSQPGSSPWKDTDHSWYPTGKAPTRPLWEMAGGGQEEAHLAENFPPLQTEGVARRVGATF